MKRDVEDIIYRFKSGLSCTDDELERASKFVKKEILRQKRFMSIGIVLCLISIAIGVILL